MIRAAVEVLVDRFLPPFDASSRNEISPRPLNRIDVFEDDMDEEESPLRNVVTRKHILKAEITTVVGAALNKQQCWEKSACVFGRRTRSFAAKDVVLL